MEKISIITVCYNSASTIEATLVSVINQTYNNIEYIVIDGGSNDGTQDIVKKYQDKIAYFVSEKDGGIYYAINKGIEKSTGSIIGILHADDIYANSEVITEVMSLFEKSNADTIYGDLKYVDRENTSKVIRNWNSKKYVDGMFLKGWMPPHPSFFVKADCYKKYGMYNTTLKSAADYELMLRLLHKYKCSTSYLEKVLVLMRVGGKSNKSIKNRILANREDKKAWEMNGLKPGPFTVIRKPLSKISQYFK